MGGGVQGRDVYGNAVDGSLPDDARVVARGAAEVHSDDEKVANRDTKVWHGATENGPCIWTNPKPLQTIWDRAAI